MGVFLKNINKMNRRFRGGAGGGDFGVALYIYVGERFL